MRTVKTVSRLAEMGEDFHDWYSVAWQELQSHNSPQLAVDCLAITSPRCQLLRNCELAKQVIAGIMPAGIIPSVQASIRNYWRTGIIRGKKTSAFARALSGDQNAICLDVWMSRAFNVSQFVIYRSDVFAKIRRTLERVAHSFQWCLAETQAAIWSGTIRQYGRNPKYFPVHLLF